MSGLVCHVEVHLLALKLILVLQMLEMCNLIDGATSWMCCATADCSVTGIGVCDYWPPTLSISSGSISSGGSSSGGGNGEQTCATPCSLYQTCQCVCMFCEAGNPGCFACKTDLWFIALVILLSGGLVIGIIIILATKTV